MQNVARAENDDTERYDGRTVIDAARAEGVPQIVHTSVSGAGDFHRAMPGWTEKRWNANYWDSKADVEDMVRSAGFTYWTILRPAFMMQNFLPPKSRGMFPDLVNDEIVTALRPQSPMVLVDANDIGRAAAAAIVAPAKFHEAVIELSGDALTMAQIAEILTEVMGRTITAQSVTAKEAVIRGQSPGWVNSQIWSDEIGYPARPEHARAFGIEPTSFREWAKSFDRFSM